MKAVVLHEYGGPGNLKYEDTPDPIRAEGEVLLHVAAASINPVDWKMRSGAAKELFPIDFPSILGRDVSGIIRTLGPGVTAFTPGDRVMALANHTYAELVAVNATLLTLVPENLDLTNAAALPLVLLTGNQLITRGAKIQSGQTVLVAGAVGGVGRAAVWTAKQAGATVIAGVRRKQLELAQSLGADELLALDDHDAMARLGFVDAVADTVGGPTAELLLAKVKQGGIFASVLGPPANAAMHPTVTVVPIMAEPDPPTLRALAEDVAAGRLLIPIDRILPLEDAGKAQAAAEKGGIGKILLSA